MRHKPAHQRVVATDRYGQVALLCMAPDSFGHGLGDPAYEAGVLEDADRRVVLLVNRIELVVPVKEDVPAQLPELLGQPGVHEVNWALVDAWLWLCGDENGIGVEDELVRDLG